MKFLLVASLLFSLLACEKNPYPGSGEFRPDPAREPRDVKPIAFFFPKYVDLAEGKPYKQNFKVSVPDPGKPVVTMEGLPAGAHFDSETIELSWKPSFFDGNDLSDPTIKLRTYPITVYIHSTLDPTERKQTVMLLKVADTPQSFEIKADASKSVREAQTLEYQFSIESLDYPQGPFDIHTANLPANTIVKKLNETTYKLLFTPDYHHVKINNNPNACGSFDQDCLLYVGEVTAINPAGHKTKKEVKIKVNDVRLPVTLTSPVSTEQGLDISFSVSAVDPNGEVSPEIELVGNQPEVGEFSTKMIKDSDNNLSVLSVSWKDIPPTYNGTTQTLKFEACVLNDRRRYDSCDQETFAVTIKVKDRKSPVFSRSAWENGEIQYHNFNQSYRYSLSARDGDTFSSIDNIKVMPVEMRKYVSWRNGNVSVKVDKEGIYQFSLVATSNYNVQTAESFVMEVFGQNRSRTLYFTDSTRNPEVRFYRDTMKQVELMNPVLQSLNQRNLSGRDTLILGTSILYDNTLSSEIELALKKIKNIVIATPLVENMPKSFLETLQRDFRVSITGRYLEIPNAPKLDQMYFVARNDLEASQDKVTLKLSSTTESKNPLIFSVGVDRKNCQDVLDFTNQNKESLYKIGVICDRKSGGRYVILGTEFSDLKTVDADKAIPATWLRQMLALPLNTEKI